MLCDILQAIGLFNVLEDQEKKINKVILKQRKREIKTKWDMWSWMDSGPKSLKGHFNMIREICGGCTSDDILPMLKCWDVIVLCLWGECPCH